ncbi:prepilin-type N-terminal cleavage/methylation domain-containing protein [Candidatus Babeliales bacterium]|nr:prepilin-type N-terminal cleavage/methylation domain-containing protein [Candidatus Babeliales bacterium]
MNNRFAFTLLEVILAISILVVAVTILSSIQFKALIRVLEGREKIERIFLIKDDFYDAYLKIPIDKKYFFRLKNRPIVNRIEEPEVKISSQVLNIAKRSELKNFADTIKILNAHGEWMSGPQTRKLNFMGFVLDFEEE